MEFSFDLNSILLLLIYAVLGYIALTLLITPFFRWPLAILLLILLLIELVLYWLLRGLIVVLEMFRLCGRSNLDLRYKVRYGEGVSTYDEWASAALQLDVLDEREKWKNNPVDDEYNYVLIMKLVHELRATRLSFEIALSDLQQQQQQQQQYVGGDEQEHEQEHEPTTASLRKRQYSLSSVQEALSPVHLKTTANASSSVIPPPPPSPAGQQPSPTLSALSAIPIPSFNLESSAISVGVGRRASLTRPPSAATPVGMSAEFPRPQVAQPLQPWQQQQQQQQSGVAASRAATDMEKDAATTTTTFPLPADMSLPSTAGGEYMDDQQQQQQQHTPLHTTAATPPTHDLDALILTFTNLLQLCIRQNVGGIQNERLYSQTNIGSKSLITTFIEELAVSIAFLADLPFIPLEHRLELLLSYRRTFGHNALCLSGGGGLGLYHSGVLRALLDDGLMPQVISGTSAGSLLAAHVCCRTDDELNESLRPLPLSQHISFDNGLSLWGKAQHWLKHGYIFDVGAWRELLRWHTCGDMTFLEAYQKTGRILVITATPRHASEQPLFLSYVTTPHIVVWSAIMASSSVPALLPDVSLYEKDPVTGELSVNQTIFSNLRDGSFRSDIPSNELSFYFNTSFFLVSQVNPHIAIFYFNRFGDAGRQTASWYGYRGGYLLSFLESALKHDMVKNLSLASEMGLWPRRIYGADFSKLFLQNFSGSTTLVPPLRIRDYINIISAPTLDDMHHFFKAGNLMVWRKKTFLSTRLVISKAITQAIESVEAQLRQ